jgi:peptidoglycan hydrolase-like amidase
MQEQEPRIRVGLTSTRDPIQITANAPYEIRDGAGALLSTESVGSISIVTVDVAQRVYSALTPKGIVTSQSLFRFQGVGSAQHPGQLTAAALDESAPNSDIVFEILSFLNRPAWSSSINDNKYRAMLEVRYADATDTVWIINELPLEQYVKGIAETSNSAPYEYQKTMTIAARTYAQYHIKRGTKHDNEHFTVAPTDADQVYRGYNSEMRLPNVSRAVEDTRGVMVFYNNALAITPYYSQSDGRTRAWEEVWGGGPYPWLVSKDDPACKGLPLLGHGVGISARGAVAMALEGKTAEEILTYYYTGVELHKRY